MTTSQPTTNRLLHGLAGPDSRLTFFTPVVLFGLLIGLLIFRDEIAATSLTANARLTSFVAVTTVAIAVLGAPRGIWSPSSAYFITFALFHAGLIVVIAFGSAPVDVFPSLLEWIYRPSTKTATWLVSLGMTSFSIGVWAAHLVPGRRYRKHLHEYDINTWMAHAAAILMATSIGGWFLIALATAGPSILVGSYDDFLLATGDGVMPFLYFGIDLAMVFVAAAHRTRWRRLTLGIFGFWALVALPLGLRGEILFPSVTALSIVAVRRRPISSGRALLLAVVLLSVIAAVRQVRAVGIGAAESRELTLNPLDGAAEMGASLRPTSEVVFWEDMGESPDGGATYWAPVDRMLYYVVPGWTRLPADQDMRLMNVLVMKRVGPIGFSVLAEAYRNFATAGVVGIMLLIGFLLGRVDTWPDSRLHQAIGGSILIALLGHVRNSFVPVPMQLVISFATIGLILLVARYHHRAVA